MQVYRQASCTLPAAHCTHATVLRRPMSLTARSDSARAPLGCATGSTAANDCFAITAANNPVIMAQAESYCGTLGNRPGLWRHWAHYGQSEPLHH